MSFAHRMPSHLLGSLKSNLNSIHLTTHTHTHAYTLSLNAHRENPWVFLFNARVFFHLVSAFMLSCMRYRVRHSACYFSIAHTIHFFIKCYMFQTQASSELPRKKEANEIFCLFYMVKWIRSYLVVVAVFVVASFYIRNDFHYRSQNKIAHIHVVEKLRAGRGFSRALFIRTLHTLKWTAHS